MLNLNFDNLKFCCRSRSEGLVVCGSRERSRRGRCRQRRRGAATRRRRNDDRVWRSCPAPVRRSRPLAPSSNNKPLVRCRPAKFDHNTLEQMLDKDEGPAPALPPRGIAPSASASSHAVTSSNAEEDGERTLVVRKVATFRCFETFVIVSKY